MHRKFLRRRGASLLPVMAIAMLAGMIAATPQAAKAAGEAPAPRRPEICTEQYAPVCGEKNGSRKTYSNSCFAAADAARVVTDGACR